MPDAEPNDGGQPGIVRAALFGLCPRCGARCLFDGAVKFAPKCRVCALDYASFNVGDGPAAFLTFLIGGLVTGLAIWLELAWQPPFWVHVLLWVPLTSAAVVWGLRAGKAALLTAEFERDAGQGRLKK